MSGKLVLLVAAVMVAIGVSHIGNPVLASGVSVGYQCDESGTVSGTITGVLGPHPVTFDVWVTDHVPSQGFWVEIPGSRYTMTANEESVDYGPLDISEVRSGVNNIRVEQSLSHEKSESFKPCEAVTPAPAPTPIPSPTITPEIGEPWFATPVPTPTATSIVQPLESTPIPVPEFPTKLLDTGGEPPSEERPVRWWLAALLGIPLILGGAWCIHQSRRHRF